MDDERPIPLPDDSYLDRAYLSIRAVAPNEEEKKRGNLRQDIQSALTSVSMPGGLFGGPRPVIANRDVGARMQWSYDVVGWKRVNGEKVASSFPVSSPESSRFEEQIHMALRAIEGTIRRKVA